MRQRLSLALLGLLVLLGTTAFAPAPFLKPERRNGAQSELLTQLQGTWTITAKQMMGGDGIVTMSPRQKVRIEKNQWQFVSSPKAPKGGKVGVAPKGKKGAPASYQLTLDPGPMPRSFRLRRNTAEQPDYMVGVLGFEGTRLRVLYRMNYDDPDIERPAFPPNNFSVVPQGWYLLTLERE